MKINQKTVTPVQASKELEEFGLYLKSIRIKQRQTHDTVASKCNFSRQTLARIERGDPSVAVGQILRYADSIGVRKPFHIEALPEGTKPPARVRRTQAELAKSGA